MSRPVTWDIETVVPGKSRKRELQHYLAGALRPVLASLGFFQPLQLAANIDEYATELGTHGIEGAHHTLFCGNDVVAQG